MSWEHRKNLPPWNKGKKGVQVAWNKGKSTPKEVRDKISGENNPNWKGDNVSYSALHEWVRLHLGKPNKCEHCNTTTAKRFEWANKSHEYKRDLGDWIRLCNSCHLKYDRNKMKLVGILT